MLTHSEIWAAIDAVAARSGFSASGLAKRAGLDPTTFNKSKRIASDGRQRWPSTESIAKVLEATGTDLDTFMSVMLDMRGVQKARSVPMAAFSAAVKPGMFDANGKPIGNGWDEVPFPGRGEENAYALEVTGNVGAPLYRDGDVLIAAPNAAVRRGDRVLVHFNDHTIMVTELRRRTPRAIEVAGFNHDAKETTIAAGDVAWISRILWASQ